MGGENGNVRSAAAWRRNLRGSQSVRMFGDLDNFLKAIFDGMNQIVFCDDSQIVRCIVEKYQDRERPRAEIEISKL